MSNQPSPTDVASAVSSVLDIISSSLTSALARVYAQISQRVLDVTMPILIKLYKTKDGRDIINSMLYNALDNLLSSLLDLISELSCPPSDRAKSKKQKAPADHRPDILLLFRAVFCGLRPLSPSSWTDSIAIKIVHSLELLLEQSEQSEQPSETTDTDITYRDAFWHTCAMLHILWSSSTFTTTDKHPLGSLLKNEVERRLCLLLRTGNADRLDKRRYEMLLATVERYWIYSGCS